MNGNQPSLPSTLYDEEYFLTSCEGYEEFIDSEGEHLSRRLRHSFDIAEVTPNMRILDVGCGRGEILRHCIHLGIEAYGIDYAEVAAKMTRQVIEREVSAENLQDVKSGVAAQTPKNCLFQITTSTVC